MPIIKEKALMSQSFGISKELWLEEMAERIEPTVHFSHSECVALLKMYQRLDDMEKMDRLKFRSILYSAFQITDSFMLDRIYRMTDKTDSGYIDHGEWLSILSLMIRGTMDELIEFCYNIYDINGDRALSMEELYMMFSGTFKARGDMDEEEAIDCAKELVQITLKKLDVDQDGIISFSDYKAAVEADPLILQCCGICLPPKQALKAFQYTFTVDYTNFFADWSQHPKKYRKLNKLPLVDVNRKRYVHRKITDVSLPPPSISPMDIFKTNSDPQSNHSDGTGSSRIGL
ncbi:unnamed protein product [Allacma fusca]|uniref:EF-hand domain-containing protein n=1 Tax=Allacma fusca TaxID=39272 RepID=A0A8J2P9P5_9HEXA|nr:unnamed protein product [Allacma fusca]